MTKLILNRYDKIIIDLKYGAIIILLLLVVWGSANNINTSRDG